MPKKTKPTKRRRQPLKRQRLGGVTVTIQHDGEAFMVAVHQSDGRRTRTRCATKAEAETEFTLKCREIERGGVNAATSLSDADRVAVVGFHERTAGWTTRPSVTDALNEFIDRHESRKQSIMVAEAVTRRLDEARARGLSARHVRGTASRLRPFLDRFGEIPLGDVSPDDIREFIDTLPVGATSRGDALRAIHSVFASAVRAGKLTTNPATGIQPPRSATEEVGTITAAELGRLLAALPARSLPAVAIMALGGLRRAEAERIDWRHVKLHDRIVTVSASVAKTASRRHVPVSDNLCAWLTPHAQTAGPVAPSAITFRRDLEAARKAAKIEVWPRNALRHSCASAWVASEPDVAKVAAWLGNTPAIVHRHYKALFTESEAKAWLAVAPPPVEAGSKVVEFKVAS